MTEREEELRESLKSSNAETSVNAALDLVKEFLFPRKEFTTAELILLERIGLQSTYHGNPIELALGQLYIGLEEFPRAKRFLEVAKSSKNEEISSQALVLLETIQS